MKRVLVVGAGFSGAVVARELAEAGWASLVIDERDHIGGNCHTARESSTGVMVHQYGPHIFHTDNLKVWDYVRKFGEFMPFTNRVKVSIDSGIYSFPINLHTINQFFGVKLSPQQAREFVAGKAEKSIVEPANFEEQALKMIGEELYRAFFWGYTKKQWGCDPRELPAAILKRLPLRFNYDDNYYTSPHQGMPKDGYTAIVRQVLDHPLISVSLGTRFEHSMMGEFSHVFYSGPLDAFYRHRFGGLGYRTVFWDRIEGSGDYQGNAVINYPGSEVPYTRIHEHKHFAPWENHERTAVFVERSKETERADTPYYPKRLPRDMEILQQYRALAGQEQSVTFVGRLATYRYMDMHHVIAEALDVAAEWLAARSRNERAPVMHPAALR